MIEFVGLEPCKSCRAINPIKELQYDDHNKCIGSKIYCRHLGSCDELHKYIVYVIRNDGNAPERAKGDI